MKYSMKCTCGDVNTVDAASREDAVNQFKGMMTPDAVAQHFADKHPGQPVPDQTQVAANIDASVVEGDLTAEAAPAGAPNEAQPAAPAAEMSSDSQPMGDAASATPVVDSAGEAPAEEVPAAPQPGDNAGGDSNNQ